MNKIFWMGGGGNNWAGERTERGENISEGRIRNNWEKEFQPNNQTLLGNVSLINYLEKSYISFGNLENKVKKGYKKIIEKAVENRWNSNRNYQKNISVKQKQNTIKFLQEKYVKKVKYNRGEVDSW